MEMFKAFDLWLMGHDEKQWMSSTQMEHDQVVLLTTVNEKIALWSSISSDILFDSLLFITVAMLCQ